MLHSPKKCGMLPPQSTPNQPAKARSAIYRLNSVENVLSVFIR